MQAFKRLILMRSNFTVTERLHSNQPATMKQQSDADLALARRVISTHGEAKNLVISPLSIHTLLAMTTAGSTGRNRAQLLSYLNSESVEQLNSLFSRIVKTVLADSSPSGGPLLSTANGLWVDRSVNLKAGYRDIVENSYNAAAECVDFQNQGEKAIAQVNEWAEKQTKGLIKQIIPNMKTDELSLILANAVYFKGVWDKEFVDFLTKEHKFYRLDGSSVRAPFMSSWLEQYVDAFDGFKVLRLPYRQGDDDARCFSMYIYLPDARDGLPALLEKICSEPDFISRHLPTTMVELSAFRIPRFKIAFELEASEVMKGLGVVELFKAGGLSEMVENRDVGELLFVSEILHKAFMEVNERGTEAAAVTAAVGFGCAMGEVRNSPPLEFVADHPFVFVIREDRSGELLFVGQLLDPLANASSDSEN